MGESIGGGSRIGQGGGIGNGGGIGVGRGHNARQAGRVPDRVHVNEIRVDWVHVSRGTRLNDQTDRADRKRSQRIRNENRGPGLGGGCSLDVGGRV